ncbi:hypothetical protein S245_006581 [Arachis hypogaea]
MMKRANCFRVTKLVSSNLSRLGWRRDLLLLVEAFGTIKVMGQNLENNDDAEGSKIVPSPESKDVTQNLKNKKRGVVVDVAVLKSGAMDRDVPAEEDPGFKEKYKCGKL